MVMYMTKKINSQSIHFRQLLCLYVLAQRIHSIRPKKKKDPQFYANQLIKQKGDEFMKKNVPVYLQLSAPNKLHILLLNN